VQVGAKVTVSDIDGRITEVFSVSRQIIPGESCLWCSGFIPPARLQEEATATGQLRRQRYVDDPDVVAPSVITLNAVAAAHAANEFLFTMTGLAVGRPLTWYRWDPRRGRQIQEQTSTAAECSECSHAAESRFGRGDNGPPLPWR
jgi:hypothetical protein